MKPFLSIFIFTVVCYINSNGQTNPADSSQCNFLSSLKFKNGKAQIEVIAMVNEVGKISDRETLKKLESKGILKSKDFGYALVFHPIGCEKTYYISCRDSGKQALSLFKLGGEETKVKLSCIVFENYKLWDYPYFIVDKVKLQ